MFSLVRVGKNSREGYRCLGLAALCVAVLALINAWLINPAVRGALDGNPPRTQGTHG